MTLDKKAKNIKQSKFLTINNLEPKERYIPLSELPPFEYKVIIEELQHNLAIHTLQTEEGNKINRYIIKHKE